MFAHAFENIDDLLSKEAGCTTELDYTEQRSWLDAVVDLPRSDEVGEAFAGFQNYLCQQVAGAFHLPNR